MGTDAVRITDLEKGSRMTRIGRSFTKQAALNEKGAMVNGRSDTPNRHDVLTGSQPDGRAFPAGDDGLFYCYCFAAR